MRGWYKLINAPPVGNCPVCGDDMESLDYAVTDDGQCEDSYTCDTCAMIVTYFTRNDRREYHEYNDGEIRIGLEPRIVHHIERQKDE